MSRKPEILSAIARQIWEQKYRLAPQDGQPGDGSIEDMWRRAAHWAAGAETKALRGHWACRFYEAMEDFAFLPAGRILSGAGAGRKVTLFNCFVMGAVKDDMASIFDSVKEAALTMQQGGGIGCDFSTLRPRGALVRGVGADASGPVSFMDVWDAMCRTIMSAGARRGAMMAVLRCDHPDIEDFIAAKRDPARLRNFNVSVLATDPFMQAVADDAPWDLTFDGKIYKTLPARALWDRIMRAAYDYAEPGVVFIDRVNALNDLGYCETVYATNPCGEQPLPPFGACLLGSVNLARLVSRPFEANAALDENRLDGLTGVAVRFLDNVIDVSGFPLAPQAEEAKAKRRIGLGVTGLADALMMCGQHYGLAEGRALAKKWLARIERAAYLASAALAREKGPFPLFEAESYLARPHAGGLDADVREAIGKHGLRNGVLTSIAPAGTISLLAGNVSSGIEPAFDFIYRRRILEPDGGVREETVEDYAYRLFRLKFGPAAALPSHFVTAHDLTPAQHMEMQAALQPSVGASISKTVNCPAAMSFEAFKDLYAQAYALGLKGCTAYRPNAVTGSVLSQAVPPEVEADAASTRPVLPAAADGAPPAFAAPSHLDRAPALAGFTYKLKWPGSDHAIYVTVNDTVENGERRPFEIFINSKNLEHYAWTVALTRMISAVFRRGGDVSFVHEELQAVFDPRGGYWLEGRYVPSLLAAIGAIVQKHMIAIGFTSAASPAPASAGPLEAQAAKRLQPPAKFCPRCAMPALIRQEGCSLCRNCGYTTCA